MRRFGRDLTELAAKGALPPLIGRREEMLKITQILLQSRKNNLILVGEPGCGEDRDCPGICAVAGGGEMTGGLQGESGRARLRIRTIPGDTTVKEPGNSRRCSSSKRMRIAAFLLPGKPASRTRITP